MAEADEYRRWFTPKRALGELERERLSVHQAKQVILARLAQGALSAMAYRSNWAANPLGHETEEEFPRVPRALWATGQITEEFWNTGDVQFPQRGRVNTFQMFDGPILYVGIKLDPIGIEILIDFVGHLQNQKAETPLRRGPKPKAFWAPMMADIQASISNQTLTPSSLADVERAMRDWLIQHNEDAGESTIRNYARRVWRSVDW